MATAIALLDKLNTLSESVSGAAERVKGAAGQVTGAVVTGARGAVDRAKELVGITVEPDPQQQAHSQELQQAAAAGGTQQAAQGVDESSQLLDELTQSCHLTFKQRLYGFVACISIGFMCTILSLFVFFHPLKFAMAFSFGNLLSLGSTGFLIGFQRQYTMMFDPSRRGAAIIFVVSLILTLLVVLFVRDILLTLVLILVQSCALVWYSMSYIPYAQSAAKRLARMFYEAEF